MADSAKLPNRKLYLDFLRVVAICFVILNHTDDKLLNLYDGNITANWWAATVLFYLCKVAVPIFFMISGCLLLGRRDSYKKNGLRIVRMLAALVATSAAMYLWRYEDPSLLDFCDKLWHGSVRGYFWYLYAYIGVLVMLPLLQRLVSAMGKRDFLYFFVVCFGFVNLLTAFTPFLPALKYSPDFSLPLFGSYIGMMFAGYYIDNHVEDSPRAALVAAAALVALVALESLVAGAYCHLVDPKGYRVLDDRTITPIVLSGCCVFVIVRRLARGVVPGRHARIAGLVTWLSSCTFGVYLVHVFFVDAFRPLFLQGLAYVPDLLALFLLDFAVYTCSLALVSLLKLVPGIRSVL